MNLVKIELVFENCECVEYEYDKDFRYFDIGSISVGFSNFCNGVSKYQYIDGFTLILTNDADTNRLGNDVTQLLLTYQDGSAELYIVKWSEDEEYYHSGQKKIVTAMGNTLFTSVYGSYTVDDRWEDEDEIDAWCW